MPWTCPQCGRALPRKRQPHDCGRHSVQDHLSGAAEGVESAFVALQAAVDELGAHSVAPMRSDIEFRAGTTFLSVRVRPDHLLAELRLPERLADERFTRVGPRRGGGFPHILKLAGADEVDTAVRGWLAAAYASAGHHARQAT
jgi:hypothetical protein